MTPRESVGGAFEEASEIIGLQVYTHEGIYLGSIDNVIVDLDKNKVDAILVRETNPLLVEDSRNVAVPYRWIQAIGDVILLRYFPKRVSVKKSPEEEAGEAAPVEEETPPPPPRGKQGAQ